MTRPVLVKVALLHNGGIFSNIHPTAVSAAIVCSKHQRWQH